MLEHVPSWLGSLLRNVRAGHEKLAVAHPGISLAEGRIDLTSPAFRDCERLPVRFTADGDGVSPPLAWGDIPSATQSLALIVEDPDAPSLRPLVHGLVMRIPAADRQLLEGAMAAHGDVAPAGEEIGRNSFFSQGWLPPDPPTGHGEHDYVFQLFALDVLPEVGDQPGRGDLLEAIAGHVLATGLLVGTCSREATAAIQATQDQVATTMVPSGG